MKKFLFLSAALLLLTASCSNDENNEQKEPTQTVQFSFTNEDFGEDETLTRTAETAKPQIVDLGDCEAEISVESEPVAKTRGTQTPANGHYTIRAYQAGTLKGEMSGTFNGGTFTPDVANKGSIKLAHGTYDFVAFNDDVVPSGNELTVARDKAATAMIGIANAESINQEPDQQVTFTMKHVGARLRTQFVCQKHIPNAITATLEQTAANVVPASIAYNPTTKVYTATNGAINPSTCNSPACIEAMYSASNFGQNYAYTSTSADYHYFLPGTEAANLKLSFSAGTVFWKPLTATQKLNIALSMQSNKSYLVKIKLKPNYTYLMSDGTTGHFKDTTIGGAPAATAKTPIALVVDKDNHIAIALNEANGGATMRWCNNTTNSYWYLQTNTHMVPIMSEDAFTSQTTSGVDETWDPSYSTSIVTGNKVKGQNPDFLAFKAAADYNPGVAYTGSPALQWYLPSANDFLLPIVVSGFGEKIAWIYKAYAYYQNLVDVAFTQVGGTSIFTTGFKSYWTSTEYHSNEAYCVNLGMVGMPWNTTYKTKPGLVRPFVKY